MEKLTRQQLIAIIMKDDEDNEAQLEFLGTLTITELLDMTENVDLTEHGL